MKTFLGCFALLFAFSAHGASLDRYKTFLNGTQSARAQFEQMVYDRNGLFEARPCPLGIPTPNDITISQPQAAHDARATPGVRYADDTKGHFGLIDVRGRGNVGRLDLALVREDGEVPFRMRFEQPLR